MADVTGPADVALEYVVYKKIIMKTKLPVILGVGACILLFFIVGYSVQQVKEAGKNSQGGNNSISVLPTSSEWKIYTDSEHFLSLKFPPNYFSEEKLLNLFRGIKPLKAVEFIPIDQSKVQTETILLKIYPVNGVANIQDWVTLYATPLSFAKSGTDGPQKAVFNLVSDNAGPLPSIPSRYLILKPEGENISVGALAVLKGENVYIMSHTTQYVEDIYEKMISSLTFE